MANLQELLAQREALTREIERAQRESRAAALKEIHKLMADYGITPTDLMNRRQTGEVRSSKPVTPKYVNSATGETWSGRGLQPRWLKTAIEGGRTLQEFLVPSDSAT